jgi:hypothetical protein
MLDTMLRLFREEGNQNDVPAGLQVDDFIGVRMQEKPLNIALVRIVLSITEAESYHGC